MKAKVSGIVLFATNEKIPLLSRLLVIKWIWLVEVNVGVNRWC